MRYLPLLFIVLMACNQSHEHELPEYVFEQPGQPIPDPRPTPPTAPAGFQGVDNVEQSILDDLGNLDSDTERKESRYFIGCERSNNGQDLDEYTQGINRGINQLSSERELFYATPVGGGGCIYRVDLSKIGWTKSDWNLIADADVLQFKTQTVRGKTIQFLTQAKRPYLFGSSGLLAAYEGDAIADRGGKIYYTLMNQAADTTAFLASEDVDRQSQVNDEEAMFSGFSSSQIALGKTRIINVFESKNGACIGTLDTALGGDDIFKNPFSVELTKAGQVNGAVVSNKLFKHDAQEWICSLPNGLFANYRLNNAADVAQSIAPGNVVVNLQGAANNIDTQIRVGDCMTCHYKESAILGFKDQLRAHLTTNPAFNNAEKKLGQIFFRFDKITAKVSELNNNHARAMTELKVTAKEDPLWNVVLKQLRKEMTIDQVAAFMLLDTRTFTERLRGSPQSSQIFGNLISGGTVSLATLSQNFTVLSLETQAYEDENL